MFGPTLLILNFVLTGRKIPSQSTAWLHNGPISCIMEEQHADSSEEAPRKSKVLGAHD